MLQNLYGYIMHLVFFIPTQKNITVTNGKVREDGWSKTNLNLVAKNMVNQAYKLCVPTNQGPGAQKHLTLIDHTLQAKEEELQNFQHY
jgi:hypothetical protein